MKAFFTIILLMIAATGICQRKYTYENKGVNMFLEAEGNGNLDFALGGPSFTVGYQVDPHFFLGVGLSNKYGSEREIKREKVNALGWYDANTNTYHTDYYIDEKGERRKIYDNANGDGDQGVHLDYDGDCEECDGLDAILDIYADVRYNILAHSRYTPYISFRTGCSFGGYDSSSFNEFLLGCRFGCGEGDFAIVFGTGWTYRNFRSDDYTYNKNFLTLKLGVEF